MKDQRPPVVSKKYLFHCILNYSFIWPYGALPNAGYLPRYRLLKKYWSFPDFQAAWVQMAFIWRLTFVWRSGGTFVVNTPIKWVLMVRPFMQGELAIYPKLLYGTILVLFVWGFMSLPLDWLFWKTYCQPYIWRWCSWNRYNSDKFGQAFNPVGLIVRFIGYAQNLYLKNLQCNDIAQIIPIGWS